MSWRSECQTEQYFVTREGDRPLDGVGRNVAVHREMQQHAQQAPWRIRGPLAGQRRVKPRQRMSSLAEDVDDVSRHAPKEGHPEQLHR